MKGVLALEDGKVFEGTSFGADSTATGEICFNTSMTGYQEILTDPSYRGQIINFTYPLIGNYGIHPSWTQSDAIQARACVVRENCKFPSHSESVCSLSEYLKENNIPALEGIDTRQVTLRIRNQGAMRACVTNELSTQEAVEMAENSPALSDSDFVKEVSTKEPYFLSPKNGKALFHLVVLDFGIKRNILKELCKVGFSLKVMNAFTPTGEILKEECDGVFLSNGPGDPARLTEIHKTVKELISKKPIFAICLGCQILAHSFGGKTRKLKFGHRGGNHPVQNLSTQKIEITSQNHGFAVEEDSLPRDLEITHINLNDRTVEGIRHKHLPIFGVQYHPEGGPGPRDGNYLFSEFVEILQNSQV